MSLTREAFLAFYPQFSAFTPELVLDEYLRLANARFEDFLDDADEARRLYTAHRLTLYAQTVPPEGMTPTMAVIASSGEKQQRVASKKVGEVAVSYAASSSSSADTALADLTETTYGLQLLSLIRIHSFGRYVP